jgi:hypothetical protein
MLLGCLGQFQRVLLRNFLFKYEKRGALVRSTYWLMFSACLLFCGSASAGLIYFSGLTYSANGSGTTLTVTVGRIGSTAASASVNVVSADLTATSPADFTAVSELLTWAIGDGSLKTFTVSITDGILTKGSERFLLKFLTPVGDVAGGDVTVGIKDSAIRYPNRNRQRSALDFTAELTLLAKDVKNLNIEKPQLLDLKQESLLDTGKTILNLVNAIPILPLTDITTKQDTSGLLTIDIEINRLYFRPVAVKSAAAGEPPNVHVLQDGSVEFLTSQGWFLEAHPALADKGISVFQEALAAAFLPGLVITETGNMTIQKDQGAAPYELDELDNVIVNYSFYDRWHYRPSMLSSVTAEKKEGISLTKHPVDNEEYEVSVIYSDGPVYRQQILSSAPINGSELIQELSSNGIRNCAVVNAPCGLPFIVSAIDPQLNGGVLTFDVLDTPAETKKITLFADYEIRKVPNFIPTMIGFTLTNDQNKDTLYDYRMIYANGEEQYFFLVSGDF